MKRILSILLCAALIPLASCGGDGDPLATLPGGVISALSGAEAPDATGADVSGVAISLQTETLTPSNDLTAVLLYPALTGLSDTLDEKINTALAARARAEFSSRIQPPDAMKEAGVRAVWEVTSARVSYLGDNLCSVISHARAEYTIPDPDHGLPTMEDVCYAYSSFFNLSTGEEISPANVFSDFGAILDLLAGGTFTVSDGLPCANLGDLVAEARTNALHGVYPPAYLTEDSLVLVLFSNDGDAATEYSAPLVSLSQFLFTP